MKRINPIKRQEHIEEEGFGFGFKQGYQKVTDKPLDVLAEANIRKEEIKQSPEYVTGKAFILGVCLGILLDYVIISRLI